MSHGTCSYICMYINAVADSVILYSLHDPYNIIFKIKHKLYIASGSVPPPAKNSRCAPAVDTSTSSNAGKFLNDNIPLELLYVSGLARFVMKAEKIAG